MDRGARQARVHRVAQSQTQLKQLSARTHTHTHTHLIYPFICQWTFRLLSCLSYLVNSAEMTVGVSNHILNAHTSDLGPAVRLISLTCPACHHQPCLLSFFSCHLSFLECLISLLMPFIAFPVKFPDQDAFPA